MRSIAFIAALIVATPLTTALADRDGDGIGDDPDQCPDDKEDEDKFEDADGCPDPDNDRDNILDDIDKCPNEPEVYDGVLDTDGCPDGKVFVSDTRIEVLDRIAFAAGSAKITKKSFPLLTAIADTVKGNPDITLVEIAGHSDRGEKKTISKARADAVRKYLVAAGIEPARLKAVGHGATQLVDTGKSRAAREKNRRVSFTVTRGGPAKP